MLYYIMFYSIILYSCYIWLFVYVYVLYIYTIIFIFIQQFTYMFNIYIYLHIYLCVRVSVHIDLLFYLVVWLNVLPAIEPPIIEITTMHTII